MEKTRFEKIADMIHEFRFFDRVCIQHFADELYTHNTLAANQLEAELDRLRHER